MATATQQPRTQRSNSLQRMLALEKQSMLDRRAAHTDSAQVFVDSPCTTHPTHTTPPTPASPASSSHPNVSSNSLPAHTRHTIPRRQLPPESNLTLALRDPNRQTAKPADPASLQNRSQQKTQLPFELPPINTGVAVKSLAEELFGSSVSPLSPSAQTPADRRRQRPEAPTMATAMTPTKTSGPDNVAASTAPVSPESDQQIEDRRSMCQSPSWEAYGRRKKEKKEKELADKEAKAKKRRLSKVPPPPAVQQPSTPSSPKQSSNSAKTEQYPPPYQKGLSATDACMSDSALHRPRQQKERPASVLGLASLTNIDLPLPNDVPAPHSPRGRSSSFSSLLKAPFESRRHSTDRGADTGFIGGIKLEQHRLEAHERALNQQAIPPDLELHPAFRKTAKRSASPLRFFTPRSEPKDPQKRSYPPIAIRTSAKNQGLLAPEPDKMDDVKVNKWRTRVGLKAPTDKVAGSKDRTGHKLTKTPSSPREDNFRKLAVGKNFSTPAISAPIMVHKLDGAKVEGAIDDEKRNLQAKDAAAAAATLDIDHSAHPAFASKRLAYKKAETPRDGTDPLEEGSNSGSETNSQPSFRTAPLNAPSSPPPPPRRSSKRKSLGVSGDASMNAPSRQSQPRLATEPEESLAEVAQASKSIRPEVKVSPPAPSPVARPRPRASEQSPRPRSNRWSMSNPPSIPYESLSPTSDDVTTPKRTLKEAARAAFGRGAPAPAVPATTSDRPASSRRSSSPYSRLQGADEGRSLSTNNLHLPINPQSKPARVLGMQDWNISPPMPLYHPAQSSEDSASDDFRSLSGHDTPDTSRPQSERGVFPKFGDSDHDGKDERHHCGYTSVLPSPAFSHADDTQHANQPSQFDLDPIQAAALKVMAAFPDVPVRRPEGDRRSNSDSNLPANTVGALRAQNQERSKPRPVTTIIDTDEDSTPRVRDIIMARKQASGGSPWPATYLENARKAAPAGLALKAQKTQSPSSPKALSPNLRSHPFSASTSDLHPKRTSRDRKPVEGDTIAKMFVECCGCKYYHDMPSRLYEAMANPEGVVTMGQNMEFAGAVSMTVKCPWCKHEMSTKCCAGLAAMVYVQERLH